MNKYIDRGGKRLSNEVCTAYDAYENKIKNLRAQNQKLIKTLEFYASSADLFEGYDELEDRSMVEVSEGMKMELLGKRARKTLAEIKKGEV